MVGAKMVKDQTSRTAQSRVCSRRISAITPRPLDEHIQGACGAAWEALGREVLRAARGIGADFDGFEVFGLAGTPHLYGVKIEHPNLRSAVRALLPT
jgi:hypothetical protein